MASIQVAPLELIYSQKVISLSLAAISFFTFCVTISQLEIDSFMNDPAVIRIFDTFRFFQLDTQHFGNNITCIKASISDVHQEHRSCNASRNERQRHNNTEKRIHYYIKADGFIWNTNTSIVIGDRNTPHHYMRKKNYNDYVCPYSILVMTYIKLKQLRGMLKSKTQLHMLAMSFPVTTLH